MLVLIAGKVLVSVVLFRLLVNQCGLDDVLC